MLIFNQTRDAIINVAHIESFGLSKDSEKGDYFIAAQPSRTDTEYYILGRYKEQEKAAEVVGALLDAYTGYTYIKEGNADGIPAGIAVPGTIFTMPEDL